VPKVNRSDVPRHAVSDAAEKTVLASGDGIRVSSPRRGKKGMSVTVTLPSIPGKGMHSALVLRYRAAVSADVAVQFEQPSTSRREHGKHLRMRRTLNAPAELELPLPDFDMTRATLTCTWSGNAGQAPTFEEAYVLHDPDDEDNLIEVVSRTPNTVEVRVSDLPAHRILVCLDAAYPGWRAFLDGASAPILRANDVFKAVIVPPGTHRVRFEFHSGSVYLGAAVSIGATLALVVLLFLFRRAGGHAEAGAVGAQGT